MLKAPTKVSRGAYQSEWQKNKAKKAKAVEIHNDLVEELQSVVLSEVEKDDTKMEHSVEVMDKPVKDPVEEDEFDLEAYSLKFVKPGIAEKPPQVKDDAIAMVIRPADAAEIIRKWCSDKPRATLIIGTNELACLITLGSATQRLIPTKIDKIASNIISGGEKVFLSQPYLNRLVAMGLVSKKKIEGSLANGYALTEDGQALTSVLSKLQTPADGETE